jgi:AraC-like DNA-binding protein
MLAQPGILSLPMTGAYFRLIMRRFGSERTARAELVAGTEYEHGERHAEHAAAVAVHSQLQQLANLQRIAPPDWGLELGALLGVVTHGPSGLVAVTAPSLAGALEGIVRYLTVRTPFVDVGAIREPGRYRLRVVEPCRLGPVRTPLLEIVLLSLQATIEAALGFAMQGAAFTMPAGRPSYWRRYDQFFHAPVTFDGGAAGVSIPEEWLSLPCPLADPVAHRDTRTRLESARQRLAGDFVDAEIEALLATGGDAGASLRDIAAALRLSERTVVRRLARRRTTYRTLLDAHHRTRSAALLAQPDLSVAAIADRLGYADATNFARACRRWFGMSPRAYRLRPRDESG